MRRRGWEMEVVKTSVATAPPENRHENVNEN